MISISDSQLRGDRLLSVFILQQFATSAKMLDSFAALPYLFKAKMNLLLAPKSQLSKLAALCPV